DLTGGSATLLLAVGGDRGEVMCDGDQYAAEVTAFTRWIRQGKRDERGWHRPALTRRTVARLLAAAGPPACTPGPPEGAAAGMPAPDADSLHTDRSPHR